MVRARVRTWRRLLLLAFCSLPFSLCLLPRAVCAPQQPALQPLAIDRGATGLSLALRRVGVSGRVLYVTAHPDDENNGVLVRLSRGLGLHCALLTLTRGEGGQNAIGPELFQALGVLRTGELLTSHRYDAVTQYFGRAYEFGYSFSVEETLAKWGEDETLGDVVRVVRAFRPDVILTLPLEGAGGGQHHQAVGRLSRDAFRAAADATRFPEQLAEGLRPWQARKIYEGGVGGFAEQLPTPLVHVPAGVFDPLLGESWEQLGSRARTMHRCQGVPQRVADPGPAEGVYHLLDAEPAPRGPEQDILDGIDTTLLGLARLAPDAGGLAAKLDALQAKAAAARAAFDASTPARAVAPLVEVLGSLRSLRDELGASSADTARVDLRERLTEEEGDVEAALVRAQGLELTAVAAEGLVTPGQTVGLEVVLWNEGDAAVTLEDAVLELAPAWSAQTGEGAGGEVAPSAARRVRYRVAVPQTARVSQPYWRRMADRDRNELLWPVDGTLPWAPPDVVARARVRIGDASVTLRTPASHRYDGPSVGGEKRHLITVAPELAVRVSPELAPLPRSARRPIELHAFVTSAIPGPADATIRLELPPGFSAQPARTALHFADRGTEAAARFVVTPPPSPNPGLSLVRAVVERDGREFRDAVQVVEYPHVERRQLVRAAEARLVAMDVRTAPGISVGYVMGSGDAVGDAIVRLGVPMTLLTADDLAFSDLGRFSTIVTGIRAYETRPDLRAAQQRLMRWVEAGGHLVVQYNRAAFNGAAAVAPGAESRRGDAASPFAPYPAAVTPERITDETAPVRALVPQHVLLTSPNRIGPADWNGWVQERGIQLLAARDPRYTDLLAATDPFPLNAGEKRGLLVDAKVGRGSWTYVGLVLFREVPAGVPGAWRLLANLVSRERPQASSRAAVAAGGRSR